MMVWCSKHMVEHRAQRVFGVVALHGKLDRFRDGNAQAAGVVRVFGQHRAAVSGFGGGRGKTTGAIGFHDGTAVGLLVVGHAHLEHLDFHAVKRAGKCQRGAPLAGAGLGHQALDAGLLVVKGLRHRGVGFVAAGRAAAFVLVINLGRRAQRFFQAMGAKQGRRPPQLKHFAHRLGNLNLALQAHLLHDQGHREQRRQIVRTHRLHGAGVQYRGQGLGQVGLQVVPELGHLVFVQEVLGLLGHGGS